MFGLRGQTTPFTRAAQAALQGLRCAFAEGKSLRSAPSKPGEGSYLLRNPHGHSGFSGSRSSSSGSGRTGFWGWCSRHQIDPCKEDCSALPGHVYSGKLVDRSMPEAQSTRAFQHSPISSAPRPTTLNHDLSQHLFQLGWAYYEPLRSVGPIQS
jgi:hypothetical protein